MGFGKDGGSTSVQYGHRMTRQDIEKWLVDEFV